jgi:ATP-dependent Clp protease ATP-binding subunit ClpX
MTAALASRQLAADAAAAVTPETLAADTGEGAKPILYCTFCAKSQFEVRKLISGPGAFICDECVALCVKICEDDNVPTEIGNPRLIPTQTLLLLLKYAGARDEQLRTALHDMVDVLRKREVSWATIGDALGVSRQAAWDRFA